MVTEKKEIKFYTPNSESGDLYKQVCKYVEEYVILSFGLTKEKINEKKNC